VACFIQAPSPSYISYFSTNLKNTTLVIATANRYIDGIMEVPCAVGTILKVQMWTLYLLFQWDRNKIGGGGIRVLKLNVVNDANVVTFFCGSCKATNYRMCTFKLYFVHDVCGMNINMDKRAGSTSGKRS
jgi:hypothetical protein